MISTDASRRSSLVPLCLLVAGCSLVPSATPSASPPNGTESMPGPSYVHITADPAAAESRLTFGYMLPDGSTSRVTDIVEAGDIVEIDRTSQPGQHRLIINGTTCDGSYVLEVRVVVDVEARIDDDGCSTTILGTRPETDLSSATEQP